MMAMMEYIKGRLVWTVPCPECKGTGRVSALTPCSKCGGNGRVESDKPG